MSTHVDKLEGWFNVYSLIGMLVPLDFLPFLASCMFYKMVQDYPTMWITMLANSQHAHQSGPVLWFFMPREERLKNAPNI